ncbi:MAG: hypothetical protein ABI451_02880 [Dokdonella sp.]
MKTPALRPFLDAIGHVVHHLNTIAVGLAGVESGVACKPTAMDISWRPADLRTSSRAARSFALNATIVFTAEELCAYVDTIIGVPGLPKVKLPTDSDRAQRLTVLAGCLDLPSDHLLWGPLLLLHWRNRVIHRRSNAGLSKTQRDHLLGESAILAAKYKSLDAMLLLDHFKDRKPTLKDVSSLIAMTINCVKRMEDSIPEPSSPVEVMAWIAHLGLAEQFDRVKRVSAAQRNPKQAVANFFTTHCPELRSAYVLHCENEV